MGQEKVLNKNVLLYRMQKFICGGWCERTLQARSVLKMSECQLQGYVIKNRSIHLKI